MRWIILIISFCLIAATSLEAEGKDVEVIPTGKKLIETEPKKLVTAVFLVANKTRDEREFTSHTGISEGWTLIAGDTSFELGADESDVRLVSFFIPQATSAGTYDVTYLVKERDYPSVSDFCILSVIVLPVTKLEARLLEAPEYVIAGDSYQASFVITNGGNMKNTVSVKIRSGEGLPFTVDAEEIQLAPGESETVTVTVKTDAETGKIMRHYLELAAQVLEDKQSKAQAKSCVKVIPRVTRVGDRFHRIPVTMANSGHASLSRLHPLGSGFQTEITGVGTLDEERKRYASFLLRGPDIRDKVILGKHDEYRFNFWTKDYRFDIGDDAYHLSPLTENYGYGRGIGGKVTLDNLSLGAYHQKARWITPERKQVAGYVDYLINEKHRVGLNYLNKGWLANAEIVSLHGQLNGGEGANAEIECALGERDRENKREHGYAYLLRAYGRYDWISYQLNYTHAQPDYPGYYRDTDSFSAGIGVPIRDKFKLNASFGQMKNNLDLDTRLRSARLERHYRFGLNYGFATGTSLSFDYGNRSSKDRFPSPSFDYVVETYRLGSGHSFRKLTFNTSFEFGKSENNLTGQRYKEDIYTLSTHYRPSNRRSYSGYIQYCDSGRFTGERFPHLLLELNGSFQIGDKTFLELRLQRDRYLEGDFRSRSSFLVDFTHTLRNGHKVSVSDRRIVFGDLNANDLMVEYTTPFGLPVKRKKDIGAVKGNVYWEESKEPISDAILRLDELTAVTDGNGRFAFRSLKPGTYYLKVNTARIGMNLVTVQKTPMEVTVEDGKESLIEIGVARSAALAGQVMLYTFENGHGSGVLERGYPGRSDEAEPIASQGLVNILVELTNEEMETKRRVTDREGYFSFEELRPGKWTLKIHEDGIPKYHYPEKDRFEFELKPGEKKEVLVKVLPKKRRIRIIEEGGTIKEEDGKESGD